MAGSRDAVLAAIDAVKSKFESEYPAIPESSTGQTMEVLPGQSLQDALDRAQGAVTLLLTPEARYGDLKLRNRAYRTIIRTKTTTPTGWNTIRTSPKPWVRYVETEPGAHDYTLIGLGTEVLDKNHPDYRDHAMWQFGTLVETSVNDLPTNNVCDRVHLKADPMKGGHRGIAPNCRQFAAYRSVIEGIWQTGRDSAAIIGWQGPGPYDIQGNYLEASGENFIMGGQTTPPAPGFMPSGLTFRKNYVFKRPEWKPRYLVTGPNPNKDTMQDLLLVSGHHYASKNLFELKEMGVNSALGYGALIEFNLMENSWDDAQDGFAMLLTVREGTIDKVKVRYNVVRNCVGAMLLLGQNDGAGADVGKSNDLNIYSNLFRNVQSGILINRGWNNLRIQRNTFTGIQDWMLKVTGKRDEQGALLESDKLPGFRYLANVGNAGDYFIVGDGIQQMSALWPFLTADAQILGNVIGDSLIRPIAGDFFPSGNAIRADAERLLTADGTYPLDPFIGAEIAKMQAEIPFPTAVYA